MMKVKKMQRKRSKNYRTTMNVISGLGVMVVNIIISFFLSPYIIRTIGVEANGFVDLTNNFVSYANLVVTALNAMAARFVTIAFVNKDYEKANLYYNSVFWGNLIIVGALLGPASYFIGQIDRFVNVPTPIVSDVKILFSCVFFSFFLRTGMPNWDCGTYVTNRMDRNYIPQMLTTIIKSLLLFGMFCFLQPHVWYVGFTAALITTVNLMIQCYNTHTLTPELRVAIKKPICSFRIIKELVGSGIWNSFAIAGNTLMNGLDLLVCNRFLGPTLMGVLAISKSLPSILTTFSETIRGSFGPELTIAYANGDSEELKKCLQKTMKIASVMVSIPTAGIIVMSGDLYRLWIPSQDAFLLQVLTILAIFRYVFCSGLSTINNIFTTVNKVKYNTIALIITGLTSIGVTMLLILFTDLDLYAVAGVSSVIMIIKDLVFMAPISAHFLNLKWYYFYKNVVTSVISCLIIIVVGVVVTRFVPANSWFVFFADAFVVGSIGLGLNMLIVLNVEERSVLINKFRKKIRK